jgi:hypothetical protein
MKKQFFAISMFAMMSFSLGSCYTMTYSVGTGSQSGEKVKAKNHYLIYGLAPLKTQDPTKMAGNTANYDVKISHSFLDGLIAALTGGFYTPTTVTIRK